MEELLKTVAASIALGVEITAALVIAYGAVEAIVGILTTLTTKATRLGSRKTVWVHFGVWLLLGLEFELAADILRTLIAPSWGDIGQLAAIGAIRTALNYFLEKDIEKYGNSVTKEPDHVTT